MTQVPASDLGIVATSPPVVVQAGVQAALAYPTGVPQALTWVVVNNSSPFTCVVSQGQVLGQLAAFTADAFPVRTGAPLGVLPFAGAGTPTPGADSTVYATWYQANPGGSYPAALGSGSAALAQNSVAVPLQAVGPILPGASQFFGLFSTAGFGALTLSAAETSGNGPLIVRVGYFDETQTFIMERTLILPASGRVCVTMPSIGFFVGVTVQSGLAAGNLSCSLSVTQQTFPVMAWLLGNAFTSNINQVPTVIPSAVVTVGAGATVTIGANVLLYAGPATLFVNTSGLATYVVTLEAQDATGTWTAYYTWSQGTWGAGGDARQITVPPVPLRIRVNNTTGAGANVRAALTSDDWRAAA